MELSEKKKEALEDLKLQNWHKMYFKNWGVGGNIIRGRTPMQFFIDTHVRFWVTYTMEWIRTPQGHKYWSQIHEDWDNKYKDYGE